MDFFARADKDLNIGSDNDYQVFFLDQCHSTLYNSSLPELSNVNLLQHIVGKKKKKKERKQTSKTYLTKYKLKSYKQKLRSWLSIGKVTPIHRPNYFCGRQLPLYNGQTYKRYGFFKTTRKSHNILGLDAGLYICLRFSKT